ncbi:hypothetical protein DESC_700081 [Desulfosarcina cetonica]|nr:hypothetical protein DESC_700081 [Desulfosarcina cetonica]
MADGRDDRFGRLLLVDVAAGTGPQTAFGVDLFVMHGKDQHGQRRVFGVDGLHEVEAVALFQRQIHDHQVRGEVSDGLAGLVHVLHRAAYAKVRLLLDQVHQAHPEDRVILDDQDPTGRIDSVVRRLRHRQVLRFWQHGG